jgi:hypothetical protein
LQGRCGECFSDPKSRPREYHLHEQKVDSRKAREIIRDARKHCGLKKKALKDWVRDSWDEVEKMIGKKNPQIIRVAEQLEQKGQLDDEEIKTTIRDRDR